MKDYDPGKTVRDFLKGKEEYCICTDVHLSVPEKIESGHCVYCGKPTFAIWKMLKIQERERKEVNK